jgi:hypothetical protein
MKVFVHACLVVLFLGWSKLSFLFLGESGKTHVPFGLHEVDRASKGTNLFASFMMTLEEQFPNRQTPIALQAARRVLSLINGKSFQPKAFLLPSTITTIHANNQLSTWFLYRFK